MVGAMDIDEDVQVVAYVPPEKPLTPFPGFIPGNLIRVRMVNFLTYTDTSITPGPRMNVILGPNGTGKSSIVNAVCLVFAGSLRLLGRSTDLGAFVKHGENDAMIEALLYDPSARDGLRCVKRKFDCDGKGWYELDGRKVKAADVVREINDRYDIQLDNLSQFMPQEKIADFVNLKNDELLTTTVRSLGGVEKERTFNELAALDREIAEGGKDLESKLARLRKLQEKHQAEKAEVQAYLKQQEAKRVLRLLQKFLPTAEAKEAKGEYIEALQRRRDCEDELTTLKSEIQQVEMGDINRRRQELEVVTSEFRSAKEACKDVEKTVHDLMATSDQLSMKLSAKTKDLQDIESTAERRRKDIERAEEHLAALEKSLEQTTMDVKEHVEESKLAALQDQRDKIMSERTMEENRRAPLEARRQNAARQIRHNEQRLRSQSDVRQERIRHISHTSRKRYLADVDQLVQDMKATGAFQRNVCGPVGSEIEVDNQYHARIMESCCSGFYVSAFVTESARDSRLLIDECKRKFAGWAPDIISAPTTRDDEPDTYAIQSQVPKQPVDDRLRSFGIEGVVSDIYRAPPAVRAALNAQAGLHLIHVGNERAASHTDQLMREEGMVAWYTPNTRCKVLTSRYDRSMRSLVQETSFANLRGSLFSGSMEDALREQERLKAIIREAEEDMRRSGQQILELEGRMRELSAKLRETDNEIRHLIECRKERRLGRAKVETARRRLEERQRRAEEADASNSKAMLSTQVRKLQEEAAENIPISTKQVRTLVTTMGRLDELQARRIVAQRALEAEEGKHTQAQEAIRTKEEEVNVVKRKAREAKASWKRLEETAQKALSQEDLEENQELFAQYEALSMEGLRQEIAKRSGQIAGSATGGRHMAEQYEHRQRQIDALSKDVRSMQADHEGKLEELRSEKRKFLDWLKAGVSTMRRKFSELYERLGCSGDLELVNTDSDSISDLELQVLVSYRDGVGLRPISAQANSGGEKMCCTMLFCFSLLLEDERMPPFVFVDELNQGLDYVNEQKIMRMMFEDAAKDRAPQSFVITPKLLPNLPFHSQTMTHVIFNGMVSGKDLLTSLGE